jgi:CRP-like cAMP-binding protein
MPQPRNQVLTSLKAAEYAVLERAVAPCDLTRGQILDEPNKPIEHIYFPESGIASVLAVDDQGRRIEVGPFGREGMSGIPIVMGTRVCPLGTQVQVPGTALRMSADALEAAINESPTLHRRLLRYAKAFSIQTAQTLLVNGYANIEQRLARWLLMSHDRVDGDELPLTHDFISEMLFVRRAGVTEAMQMLEGRGLINATRGLITVRDRKGLEKLAGSSYGPSEAEYRRLMDSEIAGKKP